MKNRKYWSGTKITSLKENEIFVFGSNPEGIHGAGGAKAAVGFGAKYGNGRGLQGKSYALVTKNLNAGITEKSTGITYPKEGYCSVSPEQIKANIDELYDCARSNADKNFLITYQYETWANGSPKKSLNGYTAQEFLEMFVRNNIPDNIVFHESYQPHLDKILNNMPSTQPSEDKPKEYTYFFHLTSPFSNFHPSKFEYKGFTFISNEQFMMFSKAKTFKDDKTAEKIIALNNEPLVQRFLNGELNRQEIVNNADLSDQWNKLMMRVKKLGREVKNYDEAIWSDKRIKVVLFGAREKFTQNEDLKQIFLNTGDTLMCEASKFDKIWGCGLSEYDAKRTPPEKWPGLNLLGQVLDYLKTEFRNNLTKKMKM